MDLTSPPTPVIGYTEVAEFLVLHNASLSVAITENQLTPIHVAQHWGHKKLSARLQALAEEQTKRKSTCRGGSGTGTIPVVGPPLEEMRKRFGQIELIDDSVIAQGDAL